MTNRLITIPISHYCEKARWALEHCGVPYVEEAHLQLFHMWSTWRTGRSDSVPMLVTAGGVLKDSTDILQWANSKAPSGREIFPQDPALAQQAATLENEFDETLGLASRLWTYTFVLDELAVIRKYSKLHAVPRHEIALLPLAFPFVRGAIERYVGMRPGSRAEAKARVDSAFDSVASRLSGNFLVGDRFTAADLTFASLAAAVLLPSGYGVPLPSPDELPPEMREQVIAWREHPAGRFAMRLYDESRSKHVRSPRQELGAGSRFPGPLKSHS